MGRPCLRCGLVCKWRFTLSSGKSQSCAVASTQSQLPKLASEGASPYLNPRGRRTTMQRSRRDFLADVGKGMLIAGVGSQLAADMGLGTAWAGDAPERLNFGKLEPLVGLMQETPIDKLQSTLVAKLHDGCELKQLV